MKMVATKGKIPNIAPRFLGMYTDGSSDMLAIELHGEALTGWSMLTDKEK